MEKHKVLLIHNIISPYRTPLFEELGRNPTIDLIVYFTSESEKNREWNAELSDIFNSKILPGITLNIGKFDVIISAGYSSFSN